MYKINGLTEAEVRAVEAQNVGELGACGVANLDRWLKVGSPIEVHDRAMMRLGVCTRLTKGADRLSGTDVVKRFYVQFSDGSQASFTGSGVEWGKVNDRYGFSTMRASIFTPRDKEALLESFAIQARTELRNRLTEALKTADAEQLAAVAALLKV